MDYQKDIKNKDINSYGQPNFSGNKMLLNKTIYEYSYKKTEKLVTALYMVTDYMEVNDAIKEKVRSLSIELLSYIHKLSNISLSSVDKSKFISISLVNIDEILSLISIANTIGFISEMNTSILKNELLKLANELKLSLTKNHHFALTLDEKMFNLHSQSDNNKKESFTIIKDKKTQYNMSFINGDSMSLTKRLNNSNSNITNKEERIEKILNIIKGKKDLVGSEIGLSIKDISIIFTDCSEKTIQRELNLLVSKGQIKKTGTKRWSRYQPI